jgi:metallo-beta-lactamase family protein
MKITFLGGVGTVTGSKYLLETERGRLLVDCGLFQGFKQLRLRNWEPLPVPPQAIDCVILTHAHLDHSGYLPLLVRNGFKGSVLCTAATRDLCGILLPDAGHLEEQDAAFADRHGFSKHRPALPLYTEVDARAVQSRLTAIEYDRDHSLGSGLTLRFRYAGHILGAATATITNGDQTIVFSGDLGRPNDPVMRAPAPRPIAAYLVVESTYGNRRRDPGDPAEMLASVVTRTAARGGSVLIPAFAVGRAQTLLYYLYRLKGERRIPDLPVFLDSPMAIDAGDIFHEHRRDHRLSEKECREVCTIARQTRSIDDSKAIDRSHVPSIIISASGMATGGRVLHHLKVFGPDARNTVLFAGFQAPGTRGAAMVAGASEVKIHGGYVPIRAEVVSLDMLSAHADAEEIMGWLRTCSTPPRTTFITHGEPDASDALRHRVEEELGWRCRVPAYRDEAELGSS